MSLSPKIIEDGGDYADFEVAGIAITVSRTEDGKVKVTVWDCPFDVEPNEPVAIVVEPQATEALDPPATLD